MDFRLECDFILTKNPGDLDFKAVIGRADGILKKGDPNGVGAKVTDIRVSGEKLSLIVTSGSYVRPHDAVLRLKNFFVSALGKEHHLGVRDIIGRKYEIRFEVDLPPKKPVTVPYAKKVSFEGTVCSLVLEDLSEEFLRKNYVDRIVNLVKDKVKEQGYGAREEHHRVVYDGKKQKTFYSEDPSQELLGRKWIKRTPHRNQFVLGPQITELCEAIKRAIVETVYEPLGFVGMIFPKLVDWITWKKSGHMKALYYGAFNPYFYATPKSADPADWEEITDLIKITGEMPYEKLLERLEPPKGGLAFAQCPPFWTYLEGETVSDSSLPIKVFDWSGPTYRYESGGAHGFERVDELHRVETLWVGTEEQTGKLTDEVRKKFRHLMEKTLELNMREAWVTPWFMEQKGLYEVDDKMVVGTVDFEAELPYSGKWLEVQNCSNNGDSYPKSFNVKGQKGELWSGCAGGSFERYLSAFLAQKGFDPADWPKGFKKYVGKIPDDVKFL
ncbi:MAG: aminoacyl--tRNA ligase-related protein [Candidatus Altiarchaeota archaeon]